MSSLVAGDQEDSCPECGQVISENKCCVCGWEKKTLVNSADVTVSMRLDGPKFREQRLMLQNFEEQRKGSTECLLLQGLIELLDCIADKAHDEFGLDCLLEDPDGK